MSTLKIIEKTSVQTIKNRFFPPKMVMIDFWTLSHGGWKMKFSKYSYAMYCSIANFCWSKIREEVIAKNENLLRLFGALSIMQYYY